MKRIISKKPGLLLYLVIMLSTCCMDPYKTNKSHMAFYFFIVFLSVYLFIKNKKKDAVIALRNEITIVCVITIIFFLVIGGRHLFSIETYYNYLYSHQPVTLLERISEFQDADSLKNEIFRMYYFRDKTIVFHSENKDLPIVKKITNDYKGRFYNYSVVYDDTLEAVENITEICSQYPCYITNDSYVYIVDDKINSSGRIVCFQDADKYYFCSEQLYRDGHKDKLQNIISTDNTNSDASIYLAKLATGFRDKDNVYYNMRIQIIAVVLFAFIGGIISLILWGKKNIFLSVCMSVPIGVVVWSVCGIVIVLSGMAYNLFSQGLLILFFVLCIVFKNIREFFKINYKKLFISVLPFFAVLIYFACTCHTQTSYDSIRKCEFGLMLAIDSNPASYFSNIATFGFIEPFAHSLGYMLGGDYLYVIYPVFFVTSFALMISGMFLLYRNCTNTDDVKTAKTYVAAVFVLGVILLLLNFDFRWGMYYVMSHDLMAVYFLSIAIFAVLKKEKLIENGEWAILLSFVAIMITRVEGIVYVLFLITLMIGYLTDRRMNSYGIASCGICLFWVAAQLSVYNSETEEYFFTPQKAVIMCLGSVTVIIYLIVLRKRKLERLFYKHYYYLYVLMIIFSILAVSLFFAKELAVNNYPVFISHMSSYIEDSCNSGFLWIYVFMFFAVLLSINNERSRFSFGMVFGYILLVYLIFLFRGDLGIRTGIGDSARRVLVQIMPSAVWLISASLSDIFYKIRLEREHDNVKRQI